jgi:hypothetical protein
VGLAAGAMVALVLVAATHVLGAQPRPEAPRV